jgi:chitin disaccharide deacetylase
MKNLIIAMLSLMLSVTLHAQTANQETKLLIRGDDMGSSHSSNLACIQAYKNGIMRDVEVMVPCPWFLEAVQMLKENPGLDVGIHLTMNSEWETIKWRPLTCCPSLVDSNGYFFPMVWPGKEYPESTALRNSNWKLSEIEKELRAQIEMAKKHIPQLSHISDHMGFTSISPDVAKLVDKLAKEYDLYIEPSDKGTKGVQLWKGEDKTTAQKINRTIKALNNLKPGTYLFVDHPALNNAEMKAVWLKGSMTVAVDRNDVTSVFTSKEVMKVIQQKGIKLIGYRDLK